MATVLLPNGQKAIVTKENLDNALNDFARMKRLDGKKYNQNNLNDEQIEKLVTDNYNLDFLGEVNPSKKFKMAR